MKKNEDEIFLTTFYRSYEKLIFKVAYSFSRKMGMEVEELVSEFNIVFCEALYAYNPDMETEFSTYLYSCCQKKAINLINKRRCKKRSVDLLHDDDYSIHGHDPIESIIIIDNFVNNENKVVRTVAKILSNDKMPKTNFRRWLKDKLKTHGFKASEITEAFKILKTIYEPV